MTRRTTIVRNIFFFRNIWSVRAKCCQLVHSPYSKLSRPTPCLFSKMNPYTVVLAEQLVQKCGEYFNYKTEFKLSERALECDVADYGMDREGAPIQLFPAQHVVLQRLCSPLTFESADVRLVSPNPLQNISGHVTSTGKFPVTRILNLPPGYGKTILSALMCLNILHSGATRAKMCEDFAAYVDARDVHLARSTRHVSPFRVELLDNAVLIQAPLHLVGPWQNVAMHNARMFEKMHAGVKVHVSPSDPDDLRPSAFDPDLIRAHPDEFFIFVVHHDNMRDFLAHGGMFYSYAVFVSDEAADSKSAPLMPEHNLLGMYNLMVTATPAHLSDRLGSSVSPFLTETFRHPRLTPEQVGRCIASPAVPFKDAWLRSAATRSFMGNMMCDILSMNVVPHSLYDALTSEVMSMVPCMHEYSVRCADSFARRMGLVAHDMASMRDSELLLERVLNVRLSGESVSSVMDAIDRQLADIVRTLSGPRPLNPGELRSRRASLERFKGLLQGDLDKVCGLCLEEAPVGEKCFATCCAFLCCRDCLGRLCGVGAGSEGVRCPKCRVGGASFSHVYCPRKKLRAASEEYSGVKDWRAFESFVASFDFSRHSQSGSMEKLLDEARRWNLTKVVVAGPHVETWVQFASPMRTIAGFEIVRPKVVSSARKMDEVFHAFCKDASSRQILVLDSVTNASCELTGVDAKLTDLIIQIGTQLNAKQLSGRALRIGRNPLQIPVKVVML